MFLNHKHSIIELKNTTKINRMGVMIDKLEAWPIQIIYDFDS